MDVNSLVDKWIAAIVGMCLAHDKAEYVNPDDESDEVVVPMSWENGPLIHATQRAFPDKPIRVENANDHGIRFEPAE